MNEHFERMAILDAVRHPQKPLPWRVCRQCGKMRPINACQCVKK